MYHKPKTIFFTLEIVPIGNHKRELRDEVPFYFIRMRRAYKVKSKTILKCQKLFERRNCKSFGGLRAPFNVVFEAAHASASSGVRGYW